MIEAHRQRRRTGLWFALALTAVAATASPTDAGVLEVEGEFAYDPAFTGGVHVADCGVDGTFLWWRVFGPGPGGGRTCGLSGLTW